MKILIVDDEPLELEILEQMILEIGDFEVVKAVNGLEAIEQLATETIQLAFLDIQMPGMSGLEVLQQIHEKWPHTVVSIVSAFDDFTYAQRAIELGISGYLLKPFTDEAFNKIFMKMKQTYDEQVHLQHFIVQSFIERSIYSEGEPAGELKGLQFEPNAVFVLKGLTTNGPHMLEENLQTIDAMLVPEQVDGYSIIVTTSNLIEQVKERILAVNLSFDGAVSYGYGENRSIKVAYNQAVMDFETRHRSTFTLFMDYLKENYRKNLTLSDVATNVHVSASHLNRLLKKEYGKTFTEILLDIRIEKAKNLLLKNYNVEVVSDMVGFNSAAYFTVCFKKFTGVTPSRYRHEVS